MRSKYRLSKYPRSTRRRHNNRTPTPKRFCLSYPREASSTVGHGYRPAATRPRMGSREGRHSPGGAEHREPAAATRQPPGSRLISVIFMLVPGWPLYTYTYT